MFGLDAFLFPLLLDEIFFLFPVLLLFSILFINQLLLFFFKFLLPFFVFHEMDHKLCVFELLNSLGREHTRVTFDDRGQGSALERCYFPILRLSEMGVASVLLLLVVQSTLLSLF